MAKVANNEIEVTEKHPLTEVYELHKTRAAFFQPIYKQMVDAFATFSMKTMGTGVTIEDLHLKQHELISEIVVVGCGGTGSWLLPKLVKTINDGIRKSIIRKDVKLILIDGDIVEEKNLVRQNFIEQDIGQNKAEVMASRYGPHLINENGAIFIDKYIADSERYQKLTAEDKDFYFDFEEMYTIFLERYSIPSAQRGMKYSRVVFNLVDNNIARQTLHKIVSGMIDNDYKTYVIDVGNDMYNGQAFTSMYSNSNPYGESMFKVNNEFSLIINGIPDINSLVSFYFSLYESFFARKEEEYYADDNVSLYSCAEADVDIMNQDQLLVANDIAASLAHSWLISYMMRLTGASNKLLPQYTSFVCGTNLNVMPGQGMLSGNEVVIGILASQLSGAFISQPTGDMDFKYTKQYDGQTLCHFGNIIVQTIKAAKIEDINSYIRFLQNADNKETIRKINQVAAKAFDIVDGSNFSPFIYNNHLYLDDLRYDRYGKEFVIEAIKGYLVEAGLNPEFHKFVTIAATFALGCLDVFNKRDSFMAGSYSSDEERKEASTERLKFAKAILTLASIF